MIDTVTCMVCKRVANVGSPTEGTSKQQKRWFRVSETDFVCGGNTEGVTVTMHVTAAMIEANARFSGEESKQTPYSYELETDCCVAKATEQGYVDLFLFWPEDGEIPKFTNIPTRPE